MEGSPTLDAIRELVAAAGLGRTEEDAPKPPPKAPSSASSPPLDLSLLLGLLGGGEPQRESPPPAEESPGPDPVLLARLLRAVNSFRESDRDTELLRSLMPYCGAERQKRLREAMTLLRILKLLPLLSGGEEER